MRLKVTSRRASFRRTAGQCLIVAAMFGASLTVLTAPGRAATTLLVPEDWEQPFAIRLVVREAGGAVLFAGETSTAASDCGAAPARIRVP